MNWKELVKRQIKFEGLDSEDLHAKHGADIWKKPDSAVLSQVTGVSGEIWNDFISRNKKEGERS